MKFAIIVPMMCSLLTGCAREVSEIQKLVLPDVVVYSKEVQNRAAHELQTQNVPTLAEFMKDYKVMRDQVRVARGDIICPQPAGSKLKCD